MLPLCSLYKFSTREREKAVSCLKVGIKAAATILFILLCLVSIQTNDGGHACCCCKINSGALALFPLFKLKLLVSAYPELFEQFVVLMECCLSCNLIPE